jgi:hypothetical protein
MGRCGGWRNNCLLVAPAKTFFAPCVGSSGRGDGNWDGACDDRGCIGTSGKSGDARSIQSLQFGLGRQFLEVEGHFKEPFFVV